MKLPYMLFLVVLLFSCTENTEDCVVYQQVSFVGDNLPENAAFTEEAILLSISLGYTSGCGELHQFVETTVNDTLYLEAEGVYTGCICTDNAPIIESEYKYSNFEKGINYVRFNSQFSTVLDSILIQ